jgi:hypothetical protein
MESKDGLANWSAEGGCLLLGWGHRLVFWVPMSNLSIRHVFSSVPQCDPIDVRSLLSFLRNKDVSVERRRMHFSGASQA